MRTAAELLVALVAGRRRLEPQRDSQPFAKLLTQNGRLPSDKRPTIKPTPGNLRAFGKSVFARRAIKRIKDPIASLAWEVAPKPGVKLNSELQKQIEIATFCLENPNHDDTFRTLIEQIVEDELINGAGVYEQQIGADPARPLWLWPVDTLSIQINAAWDGSETEPRYVQTIGTSNYSSLTSGIPLLNKELVYIRLDPTTEHPFGLGPLEVAFTAINRKMGVASYAGEMASNAQPENLLFFENMSPEHLTAMRAYWRNEVEGNGVTPLIANPVGSKVTVEKLRGTDDSALFIAYQELLIREIATAFGLSPMTLGVEKDVNRSTAEVTDDRDWDSAVVPIATVTSAHITRETIHRRLGFYQLEHRFNGLKREDKEAQAKIYTLEYEANAVCPNEYRARNNMPPLENEWGDMLYADVQIAIQAARGAGEVDDPNLKSGNKPKPSPKRKAKD